MVEKHRFDTDEDFKGGEPRYNMIVRVVDVIRLLLQPGGATLEGIGDELDVIERSARRYLAGLAQARVRLTESIDAGGRKFHGIDPADPLVKLAAARDPFTVVTIHMLVSEAAGFHLFGGLAELGLELMDAVADVLGPKYSALLKRLLRRIRPSRMGAYKRQPPPNAAKKLLLAMDDGLVCTVKYAAARKGGEEVETYDILPLWFHPHDSGWYVYHYSYKENAYTNLNLSRLHDVEVTKRKGEVPEGIDAEALFASSFGAFIDPTLYDVRIRFNPEMAVLAKARFWHVTEAWRPLKRGWAELTFRAPKTPELINLVSRFRGGAQALEPPWLNDECYDLWHDWRKLYPRRSVPKPGEKPDGRKTRKKRGGA